MQALKTALPVTLGVLVGLALLPASPADAAGRKAANAGSEQRPAIDPGMLTEGFLAAHPDLRWRREGLHSYSKGDHKVAADQYRRAAYYADKPAQALLADMYWRGEGVPQDRVLGYIWMDIAAERFYPDFIAFRERYWAELSAAEQAQVVERGQPLLAEYADEVAKPRLEAVLRREARKTTGSRTGFAGNLTIVPMTGALAGTGMTIAGHDYYDKKYWEPSRYFEFQDLQWRAPRTTHVEVGEIAKVAPGTPERKDEAAGDGD